MLELCLRRSYCVFLLIWWQYMIYYITSSLTGGSVSNTTKSIQSSASCHRVFTTQPSVAVTVPYIPSRGCDIPCLVTSGHLLEEDMRILSIVSCHLILPEPVCHKVVVLLYVLDCVHLGAPLLSSCCCNKGVHSNKERAHSGHRIPPSPPSPHPY